MLDLDKKTNEAQLKKVTSFAGSLWNFRITFKFLFFVIGSSFIGVSILSLLSNFERFGINNSNPDNLKAFVLLGLGVILILLSKIITKNKKKL